MVDISMYIYEIIYYIKKNITEIWTGCLLPDFTVCQTTILYRDEMAAEREREETRSNIVEKEKQTQCWFQSGKFLILPIFVEFSLCFKWKSYTSKWWNIVVLKTFLAISRLRSGIQYTSDGDIVLVNLRLFFYRFNAKNWRFLV